jgi:hypothetical protein
MSTQAVSIVAGNPAMSKIFNDTATDGVWSGNVLLDSISAQSMGILIPNATLNFVQPSYTGGCMAWRIQNAQTLAVSSRGFGCISTVDEKQYIQPVRVSPNDILTAYPLTVSAEIDESNSLAWVTTSKGTELFQSLLSINDTATAMTTSINGQSLGDSFFNSMLQSITVSVSDGSSLTSVEIVDNAGGVVMTLRGNYRGPQLGTRSNYVNLDCSGLQVPIGKGFVLNITTNKP